MNTEVSKMKKDLNNKIIIDPDYPWNYVCNIREYTPDDAAALAAGRVFAHDLPLSGEWVKDDAY